jgi:hypothetical protein
MGLGVSFVLQETEGTRGSRFALSGDSSPSGMVAVCLLVSVCIVCFFKARPLGACIVLRRYNYGVVLLPPTAQFVYPSVALTPAKASREQLSHPEAPTPASNPTPPGGAAAASPSGHVNHMVNKKKKPSLHGPIDSSVRSPMRRQGNVVWLAEVGVPMPLWWLCLQLAFDNISHISFSLIGITIGVLAFYSYVRTVRRPEHEK